MKMPEEKKARPQNWPPFSRQTEASVFACVPSRYNMAVRLQKRVRAPLSPSLFVTFSASYSERVYRLHVVDRVRIKRFAAKNRVKDGRNQWQQ